MHVTTDRALAWKEAVDRVEHMASFGDVEAAEVLARWRNVELTDDDKQWLEVTGNIAMTYL